MDCGICVKSTKIHTSVVHQIPKKIGYYAKPNFSPEAGKSEESEMTEIQDEKGKYVGSSIKPLHSLGILSEIFHYVDIPFRCSVLIFHLENILG